MLHQATLVLDLAAAPPLALLRRRTEGGRPTADPAHRVTSLALLLGAPAVRPDEVERILLAQVAGGLRAAAAAGGLSRTEERAARDLFAASLGRDAFALCGETGGDARSEAA